MAILHGSDLDVGASGQRGLVDGQAHPGGTLGANDRLEDDALLIGQGDPTGGFLPAFFVPPRDLLFGCGLVLMLGLASGLFPATQATRLRIVDALRRV